MLSIIISDPHLPQVTLQTEKQCYNHNTTKCFHPCQILHGVHEILGRFKKTNFSFSDLGSLYVIYMIILIKFLATEMLNMLNLLRAFNFNIEVFLAF